MIFLPRQFDKKRIFPSALFCAGLFTSLLSQTSLAADERWFDIEIVMFSQLADKGQLSENFPEHVKLPYYRKSVDLLTPFLRPDFSAIKNQFPICGQPALKPYGINAINSAPYVELVEKLPPELSQIEQLPLIDNPIMPADDTVTFETVGDLTVNSAAVDNELLLKIAFDPKAKEDIATSISKPVQYFNRQACQLSSESIKQLTAADKNFDPNYYPVEKVPAVIDGIEDLYSAKPYLLSEESLELTDVIKQLKYSRNFKPLLHIGWRQPAVSKRSAVPVKIYAGDNLQLAYKKELAIYEKTLAQAAAQELSIQQIINNNNEVIAPESVDPAVAEKNAKLEKQRLSLSEIFAKFSTMENDKEALINNVLSYENILAKQQINQTNAPIAPPQNWTVEGYFNVHLNHYLYINADFIIADLNSKTEQNVAIKNIAFSQDRRVISQEIHYFDHPYIGMIVEIRRHERPEPPKDAETE